MNRNRLVVCLKDSIYVHNIQDMKLLHSIKNINENPNGLIALSSSNCLAYPVSAEKVCVCVYIFNIPFNHLQLT